MAKPSKPADYGVDAGTVFLGKYRVDAILGHGGMGVVALATHLQLEERVAIKFLRDDVILDEETRRRFLREAQNAVKLKSEHVARVTDVGTFESGVPYMVMEYLEGIDLGQMLEESGKVNPSLAVELLLQACVALAEAHSLGIVHRDIKPGNLFVTWRADGSPLLKILDFGISKAPVGADMNLTQTQSLLGTPAYMSPEQMRSARTVDPRSDIWSLGTVLHEIVQGRRPFEAESFSEMCVKVAVDPPAPLTVAHPAGLEKVILRALEKRPEDRYQSIAEMARDLVPFARDRNAALVAVERMTRMLGRSRATFDRGEPSSPDAVPRGMMRDVASAPVVLPRGASDAPTPRPQGKRGGRVDSTDLNVGDSTDLIDNDTTAITAIPDGTRTTVTALDDTQDGETGDTGERRRVPAADSASHHTVEDMSWSDKKWTPQTTTAQDGPTTDKSMPAVSDEQAAANAVAAAKVHAAAQSLAQQKPKAPAGPAGAASATPYPAKEKSSPVIPALAARDSAPVSAPASSTGSGPTAAPSLLAKQPQSGPLQGAGGVTLPGLFPAAIPGARPTHQRALTPMHGTPPLGSTPAITALTKAEAPIVTARPTEPVNLRGGRGKWIVLILALGIGIGAAVFVALGGTDSVEPVAHPPVETGSPQITPIEHGGTDGTQAAGTAAAGSGQAAAPTTTIGSGAAIITPGTTVKPDDVASSPPDAPTKSGAKDGKDTAKTGSGKSRVKTGGKDRGETARNGSKPGSGSKPGAGGKPGTAAGGAVPTTGIKPGTGSGAKPSSDDPFAVRNPKK